MAMATTAAAALQPLKPAPPTSLDGTSTPDGSSSQTPVPASTIQRGEPHGFGILQHTGPPVHDDVPGLYRDGRVRNPVPSKLKGKTDSRKGNFGVMHIDLTTTNETQQRDAAAKRTSESTQLAAKLAQTDRYVPIKRSRYIHRPQALPTSDSSQPPPPYQRTSPLTASETKAEQARLLTLLRSLHPVLVVDQLCKALAFFGGLPGAQLTADTLFPDSAEANGSGSLFVGWLAEIFPALGPKPAPSLQQTTAKRPRGRPKGSKNAKGKKDKAMKRRLALGGRSTQLIEVRRVGGELIDDAAADDNWVDVEDTVIANEEEGPAEGTTRATATPSHTSRTVPVPSTSSGVSGNGEAGASLITPIPKRRGRPKGSKNRPKESVTLSGTAQEPVDRVGAYAATETAESGAPVVKKRKPGPGRPKGSKNRPKEAASAPNTESQPPVQPPEEISQPLSLAVTTQLPQAQPLQTLPQGVAATMAAHVSQAVQEPPVESTRETPATHTSTAVGLNGVKRKRKPPTAEAKGKKGPDETSPPTRGLAQDALLAGLTPSTHNIPSPKAVDHLARASSKDDITAITQPPAKRPKVPKLSQKPVSNKQTQELDTNQPRTVPADPQLLHSQPVPPADDHSTGPWSGERTGATQRARDQVNMPPNNSPSQPSFIAQEPAQELQASYGQSRRASAVAHQPNAIRPLSTGPYGMSPPGSSQAGYGQTRPLQVQYAQAQHQQPQQTPQQPQQPQQAPRQHNHQLQHQQLPHQHQHQHQQRQRQQEARQQAHPNNSSSANQHQLMNSNAVHMGQTAAHASNPFAGPAGGEGYQAHLRAMSQQSSFTTQVSTVSPENNYRNSASRSVQNQSPFQTQRQQAPSSNMPFQDYPDSAFLDMEGLGSSTQGGLAMAQTSYNMTGGAMQRPSSTANPSYSSASNMGPSSFDGGVYHALRRQ